MLRRAPAVALLAAVVATASCAASATRAEAAVARAGAPAPAFTLVDGNRRPFSLTAQRTHPVVLFFGYTHCPDECPTALAALARARTIGRSLGDVRVVFITVDPHRDTAGVMKRYVRRFDPAFVGLTGTHAQLDAVKKEYKVFSVEIPLDHGPNDPYAIAHGTNIYFIDGSGVYRGSTSGDTSPQELAALMDRYFRR
jgi:protein SCO1/2